MDTVGLRDPADLLGQRWGAWIRSAGSAKEVARLFRASPRTVEGWRGDGLPLVRHLAQAVALWGQPFLEAVFAPLVEADDADLLRRLERVRADMLFILETTEALHDAETAGVGGDREVHGALARGPVAVARRQGVALAGTARAVVALALVAGLSLSIAAGGGDQQVRLRGRARPVAARVVAGGRGIA
ncbi:MAG: hypothetical protein RIB84_23800 [Sneathiellaceae bacterium]